MIKRFKISIGEFEEENIQDTVKNIEITEISDMCTQMNTLYEENKQLKKDREELFIRERDTKNDWRELKQENEQLKKELKVYRKIASCSNCRYHNYDWDINDGYGGEEYEVCDKGNDVTDGICEDWEEL